MVERVRRGEEIIIGRAGRPVAKLVPFDRTGAPRRGGHGAGGCGSPPTSMTCRLISRTHSGPPATDVLLLDTHVLLWWLDDQSLLAETRTGNDGRW